MHLSLEALLINKGDLLKWIGIHLCKILKTLIGIGLPMLNCLELGLVTKV
jgi:hypothetical protein